MSDLYGDGRTTSTSNVETNYSITETPKENEKYFQEFREFDYGIDINANIILIQDEIIQVRCIR
jgi:hypothetical protein